MKLVINIICSVVQLSENSFKDEFSASKNIKTSEPIEDDYSAATQL